MSEYIAFFTARSDRAARRVRTRGPVRRYPSVSASWFDADDALVVWEEMLTGRPATEPEPRIVAEFVHDGSGVYALSPALVAALAGADPDRLREVARAWAGGYWEDMDDGDDPMRVLGGVAELARTGESVFCWVAC